MKYLMTVAVLFVLLLGSAVSAQDGVLPAEYTKAYISGQVTFNGAPVTGAQVMAYGGEGGNALAVNAPNGNYSLGVSSGEWTVYAMKEGYVTPRPVKVNVRADEKSEPVNIELKKSACFIEGKVVDEGGKPIPRAMVMAMPDMFAGGNDRDDDRGAVMMMTHFRATADAQGNFRMQVVEGAYMLMASARGYVMSPRNPAPKIPGMEDMPAEFMKNLPQSLGVQVSVAEGKTAGGVVIILRPGEMKLDKDVPGHRDEKPEVFKTAPNVLVGKAQLTPNNVLHWTRVGEKKMALYVVLRSTADPAKGQKGETKEFDFIPGLHGTPRTWLYSFTDSTALQGKTYWYAVYEKDMKGGRGPLSNWVMITTK